MGDLPLREADRQTVHSSAAVIVIYGLADPRTGQIRYVGKTTKKLKDRLAGHLSGARAGRPGVGEWMRSLTSPPLIIVLEEEPLSWQEAEKRWIASLPDLVNLHRGGGGWSVRRNPEGYVLTEAEVVQRRQAWEKAAAPARESRRNKPTYVSAETKEKMRLAQQARRERERQK